MFRTILFACHEFLNMKISDEKLTEKLKDTKAIIYKEELANAKLRRKAVMKSVRFMDSERDALLEKDEKKELMKGRRSCNSDCSSGIDEFGEREKMNIRVKVKMTKEEAAKFLSKFKCKEGGILPIKDVAPQLLALPLDRFTILPLEPTTYT
ncbi:unnamed protein product [Lathyrus oleraceus]|uniref:DUF7890 domain-containing protein n=1 Tax=Pisum sativum TaxID=3888 RepID=A0A9D4YI84_PEA|nr:uncharacterized protein LOC127121588 [Pisum sativum]KAI5440066.1 hypothetical protein KIW84_025430 [Pisum sativum]